MNPECLLDEPLSALDALTRANLADEIERIWQRIKDCVLITNDVDEAIILADRIIALNLMAHWVKSLALPSRVRVTGWI